MDNFRESIKDDSIDVKNLIYKFLGRWYIFAAFISISLTSAYFINKYSQRIYEVKTSILIKDEQSVLDSRFTAGLGIYNSQYKITNEIGIIKSHHLTQRALEQVNFSIDYFMEGKFFETELYKSSPYLVVIDSASAQPVNSKIEIEFTSADDFIIRLKGEQIPLYNFREKRSTYTTNTDITKKGKLFEKLSTENFAFTVIPRENVNREKFINKRLSLLYTPMKD
ncbi:MAG: hypothetical protein HC831_27180 [Chloroflexia bacterium]|nr:hypothetical protein [Chloroflexia bacterium]